MDEDTPAIPNLAERRKRKEVARAEQYQKAKDEFRTVTDEALKTMDNLVLVGIVDGNVRLLTVLDITRRLELVGALQRAAHDLMVWDEED